MSSIASIIAAQLTFVESQRRYTELIYRRSIATAHGYDGSEAAEQAVYAVVQTFETFAKEIALHSPIEITDPVVRDEVEQAVARRVAPDQPALSVDGLLQLAIESFGRRLQAGSVALHVVETGLHFLPTDGINPIVHGHERRPMEEVRIEPRTAELIQTLNQHGIYTDDIIIYKGVNEPRVLRQRPYSLIQIPRLQREILICDAVKQATYVGIGRRGPKFWATHGKEQVLEQDGVVRVINSGDWLQKLMSVLFDANPPSPKKTLRLFPGREERPTLTEDLILRKALEFAMAHDGALPIRSSGEVEGLPGQTWENINISIFNRTRGLTRTGLTSLSSLFRLYGLITIGRSGNPVAIRNACEALRSTGSHGLIPGNNFKLTEDLILRKALEYAAEHDYELPGNNSGEINGFPGQTWMKWSSALNQGSYGLGRANVRGLSGLFRVYGLKMSIKGNRNTIMQAIATLTTTGTHGLKVVGETQLTEDLILEKALVFAAKHNGRLPSKGSGGIDGLSGQNWGAWNAALRFKSNGLKREGLAGLGDLFRLYGLRMGGMDNPEAIRSAIERLNTTGTHGLQVVEIMRLSEDIILRKALEFSAAYDGKLPTPNDGEIEGLPGQTWMNWHAAIRNKANGLTRNGLNGLPSLLRAYGLKTGRTENPEVIQQAWARLQSEGHHGLVFDESRIATSSRPAVAAPKSHDPDSTPQ